MKLQRRIFLSLAFHRDRKRRVAWRTSSCTAVSRPKPCDGLSCLPGGSAPVAFNAPSPDPGHYRHPRIALLPCEGTTCHQLRCLLIFKCQKLPTVGLSLPTPTVPAFAKALKGPASQASLNTGCVWLNPVRNRERGELLFPHQTTRQACFRMGATGPGDPITSIRTPIKPFSYTVSQVRLKSEALTPTQGLHLPSSLTGLTAPLFGAAFTFPETGSTGQ